MNTIPHQTALRSDCYGGTGFRPVPREQVAPASDIVANPMQAASVEHTLPLYEAPEISGKRQRREAQAGTPPTAGTSIMTTPDTVRLELAQLVVQINQEVDRLYKTGMTPDEILKIPIAKLINEDMQHLGTISADKALRYITSSMAWRGISQSHDVGKTSTTPIVLPGIIPWKLAQFTSFTQRRN